MAQATLEEPTSSFSSTQCEFLAEYDVVTVVPATRLPRLDFISGSFGPFEPGFPCVVPLWLAVTLRQRQLCKIRPPMWLEIDALMRMKAAEEHSDESSCCPIPHHYIEIGTLLLNHASEDFPDAPKARELLEDIINRRQAKLRAGLLRLSESVVASGVRLTDVSALELNTLRPFLVAAMNQFAELEREADQLSDQPAQESEAVRQIRKKRKE